MNPCLPAGMGIFPPDPMKIFPCLNERSERRYENMKKMKIGAMLLAAVAMH
jgi:hypothetical protein